MSDMLWMMEQEGQLDTKESKINRVVSHLRKSGQKNSSASAIQSACRTCNVDPSCFTQKDLDRITRKGN